MSFIAGQAAFTVMVVILFNIIQPVGWSVGLVRIEDIALGCAAGLCLRGTALAARRGRADPLDAGRELPAVRRRPLTVAVQQLTGRANRGTLDEAMDDAKAAAAGSTTPCAST